MIAKIFMICMTEVSHRITKTTLFWFEAARMYLRQISEYSIPHLIGYIAANLFMIKIDRPTFNNQPVCDHEFSDLIQGLYRFYAK